MSEAIPGSYVTKRPLELYITKDQLESGNIEIINNIDKHLNLNEKTYSCVFIIIPKLDKNCILGVDLLKKLKGRIDTKENYIILRNENKSTQLFVIQRYQLIWVIE